LTKPLFSAAVARIGWGLNAADVQPAFGAGFKARLVLTAADAFFIAGAEIIPVIRPAPNVGIANELLTLAFGDAGPGDMDRDTGDVFAAGRLGLIAAVAAYGSSSCGDVYAAAVDRTVAEVRI